MWPNLTQMHIILIRKVPIISLWMQLCCHQMILVTCYPVYCRKSTIKYPIFNCSSQWCARSQQFLRVFFKRNCGETPLYYHDWMFIWLTQLMSRMLYFLTRWMYSECHMFELPINSNIQLIKKVKNEIFMTVFTFHSSNM